jgi:hypothetical protein
VVLSIVPIVQVESRLAFALKISAIVIVANADRVGYIPNGTLTIIVSGTGTPFSSVTS